MSVNAELAQKCRTILEAAESGEKVAEKDLKSLVSAAENAMYGQRVIRTMTVSEFCKRMRAMGVSISDTTARKMIAKGLYPFAVGYSDDGAEFEIYAKPFEKWLETVSERVE